MNEKKYKIIGYKGKQVRDNIHSFDLVNCFWQFYKKPKYGEVYNIGGGRFSNCSIIEALDLVEKILSKNANQSYEKGFQEGADQKDNKPCVCGFWGDKK